LHLPHACIGCFWQVSRLQGLHTSRYGHGLVAGRGMVHITKKNLAGLFDQVRAPAFFAQVPARHRWRGKRGSLVATKDL
jgi:hypothetical protein